MDSAVDIIQSLLGQSSWPGLIFTTLSLIIGGYYIKRSSKSKAEEIARNANKEAIEALQLQVHIQQEQIRLLKEALLEVGIRVTMDGKIMHIHKNEHETRE
jgi:hypothetical protein